MKRVATIVMGLMLLAAPAVAADGFGVADTSSGLWCLREPSGEQAAFYYGNPGDFPIMGDWNGDGIDTPGLYRQSDGFVYLRNANTQGVANIRFFFGNPGDVPLAGDFDGDGRDTVSIYRPSQARFYIINELGANDGGLGAADFSFLFGNPGDKPFVADFDGDGVDTIGLHRESTGLVYYRNDLKQGVAQAQFIFGNPGDKIIAGDWTDKGFESVGLFRPSSLTVFLRNSNTQGNANITVPFGAPAGLPVAGDVGELSGGSCPLPFVLTGSGNAVIPLSVPGNAGAVVHLTHNGSSNFIVWSLDAGLEEIDLLVNEIGPYTGRRGLNIGHFSFDGPQIVRHLDITANGQWTIRVLPLSQASAVGGALNGSGDDIVRFTASTPVTMRSTHAGSSNFVVWALTGSGALNDLIVNEIGPYNGTDLVRSGTRYLDIQADGAWTLRVP